LAQAYRLPGTLLRRVFSVLLLLMDSMTSFQSRDFSMMHKTQREYKTVGVTYLNFLVAALVVYCIFSDAGYSSVLTLGAALQCLAFFSLLQRVERTKSLAGISMKTLELYAVYLILRLGCTLTRSGYLPVDRSGDWVYQAADIASLACVFQIMNQKNDPTMRSTYQEQFDTMCLWRALPGCVILGLCIHGHLNDSFVFDSLWQASTNVDTIAMIPQLWMLSKIGGEVDGMTANFVANLFFSRACSFSFWFYGYKELRRGTGPNLAGGLLILCHTVQLILSADFLYYYAVARWKGKKLVLPGYEV
jgi:hypothetical protein